MRFAYLLYCIGFVITQWEPEAVAGRPGDLEVTWKESEPIFIEVKGPGWESELSDQDRAAGRIAKGKNVDMEVRAVDSIEYLYHFVSNTKTTHSLPDPVLQGWLDSNSNPQGPRWAR